MEKNYPCLAGGLYKEKINLGSKILYFLDKTLFYNNEFNSQYISITNNSELVFKDYIYCKNLDEDKFYNSSYYYIISSIYEMFTKEPIYKIGNDKLVDFIVILPEMSMAASHWMTEDDTIRYNDFINTMNRIQGQVLTLIESFIEDKERRSAIKSTIKGMFSDCYTNSTDYIVEENK